MTSADEKKLKKAKAVFLKHLKEVDASQGPVTQVIIKFRLPNAQLFDVFVKQHHCTMSTRIISREEQDAVDPRQKACAQYTSVRVTPEAQAAFLAKQKQNVETPEPKDLTVEGGRLIMEAFASPLEDRTKNNSSPELDEQLVAIPSAKYDVLSARLAKVIQQLPTTDTFQGRQARAELLDIGHELRGFRPVNANRAAWRLW
ncbi:hypothetical protein C8R46DRAFT_1342229 [Mycena filopes]|nr:hypothetical protein C8R46DRAFT_1342229 [Mycena filopes]